jgi:hypothetical protein
VIGSPLGPSSGISPCLFVPDNSLGPPTVRDKGGSNLEGSWCLQRPREDSKAFPEKLDVAPRNPGPPPLSTSIPSSGLAWIPSVGIVLSTG